MPIRVTLARNFEYVPEYKKEIMRNRENQRRSDRREGV
jgi:hypothetical protein